MKENYVEPMVVDKNGNIYYSAKCINELEDEKSKEIERLKDIIKEVREYIEEHTENIDRGRYYEDYVETYPILEILDKVGDSNE